MEQAHQTASGAAVDEVAAAGAPASFIELTGVNNPFSSIVEVDKAPALLDVDGDGDLDLVLGQFYSDPLLYFRNDAGTYVQQTGVANPFNSISFSADAAPSPIDIDGDGDLDLIVGWELGVVKIMLNHGGGIWGSGGNISGINTIGYSTPVAIDIDGDGRQDIVSGNLDGRFQSYHNNGDGSFTELTGAANPLDGIDAGTFSAIGFIDVDGDCDLDAVVSSFNGAVAVYADDGNRTFAASAINPFSGFGLDGDLARFSFTDIDADGDLDAVVGFSAIDSPIRVFQQAGAPTGVVGTPSNNSLGGTAGNDTLDGRGGADTMNGGFGDDAYYVDTALDQVMEGAGQGTADRIYASVSYTLGAGVQVEILSTNNAAETGAIALTGNELANSLLGNAGANVLDGGAGNDVLDGGIGDDTLRGGAGNDRFFVDSAADVVVEAAGEGRKDRVIASDSYALAAGVAVEILATADANGTAAIDLSGNERANRIAGNAGANVLDGGAGDDVLAGGDGTDVLRGRAGHDTLDGGAGADTMRGYAGNDVYFVDDAGDTVVELAGEGVDRVTATVDFILGAEVESLGLRGAAQFGTGNGLDNAMLGSSGKNTLVGLAGADTIDGGTGADTLDGGDGNDVLTGGVGKDRLTGGVGLDQFVFRDGDSSADRTLADVVVDFSHAQDDRLKLSAMDANTVLAGDQAFAFIGTGAFTGVAGQLHYVQDAGLTFVEGDTNGDGLADFSIRLNGTINLVGADFVL